MSPLPLGGGGDEVFLGILSEEGYLISEPKMMLCPVLIGVRQRFKVKVKRLPEVTASPWVLSFEGIKMDLNIQHLSDFNRRRHLLHLLRSGELIRHRDITEANLNPAVIHEDMLLLANFECVFMTKFPMAVCAYNYWIPEEFVEEGGHHAAS